MISVGISARADLICIRPELICIGPVEALGSRLRVAGRGGESNQLMYYDVLNCHVWFISPLNIQTKKPIKLSNDLSQSLWIGRQNCTAPVQSVQPVKRTGRPPRPVTRPRLRIELLNFNLSICYVDWHNTTFTSRKIWNRMLTDCNQSKGK